MAENEGTIEAGAAVGEEAASGDAEPTGQAESADVKEEAETRDHAPLPVARRQWDRFALRDTIGVGSAAALVAILLSLARFGEATLPHILAPQDTTHFLEMEEGVPVPRLMAWSYWAVDSLLALRDMSPPMRAAGAAFLLGILLRVVVAALNPSFRLFRSERTQRKNRSLWARLHITLELRFLKKALRVMLLVAVPFGLFWLLTVPLESRFPAMLPDGRPGPLWAVRLVLIGMVLWMGFHRYGIAGNFARPRLHRPRGNLLALALAGAACGLGWYVFLRGLLPPELEPRLRQYQMLGSFHVGYWQEIAVGFFGAVGCMGFAAGALLCVLGRPHVALQKRLALLGLVVLGVVGALLLERPFTPQSMAARLDITPHVIQAIRFPYDPRYPGSGVPSRPGATRELAKRVNLQVVSQFPTRDVLIFDNGIRISRQRVVSDDGLPTDADSEAKVRAFLERRNYRSALSWIATRYLYNVACIDFDVTAALSVCLDDLIRGPHYVRMSPAVREMFFICAVTPQNRAQLDRYADSRNFAFPDRYSLRMMGDLYRRFGDKETALRWYRRAEMPRSFLKRIAGERPMFHQGRVTGRLMLNGKPLAGALVGALPIRLNGLPREYEARLMNAEETLAPSYRIPSFVRFDSFRAICASTRTDASGSFALENLVEGEYLLVSALAPSEKPHRFEDRSMKIPRIVVNYTNPQIEAGTIELVTVQESADSVSNP
jgi:hypothetical protein